MGTDPHNCTLYAAYRLHRNGVGYPGWYADASKWAVKAGSKLVNQTPAVGAIAQWNTGSAGHVAYVEAVDAKGITITEDNFMPDSGPYAGGYTARLRIATRSLTWPDNFIHFKDVKPANPLRKYVGHIVQWAGDNKRQKTAWLVGSDLHRRWIADIATYDCLKAHGAPGPERLSAAVLDKLPDRKGVRATCTMPTPPLVDDPTTNTTTPVDTTPPPPPPSVQYGDSVGLWFPWEYTFHLRNEFTDGPSEYAFGRSPGQPGAIPLVGDWDGDGHDSTGYFYPWDNSFHLRNELNDGPSEYAFVRNPGRSGAVPIVGDWDGDGHDSTGYWYPWDNSFHLRNELNDGPSEYAFVRDPGRDGAIPLAGDWDGNGHDSVGLFFPWDNSFHLRNEFTDGPSEYAFVRDPGRSGAVPLAGDWDGNGHDSTGYWYPWDNSFHLRNELDGGPSQYGFVRDPGRDGAIPLAGNWDGQ